MDNVVSIISARADIYHIEWTADIWIDEVEDGCDDTYRICQGNRYQSDTSKLISRMTSLIPLQHVAVS
jgi:hypothetical protein